MLTMNRFEGKVALITGAARGMGRAEAVRLAQEGADIIAIDICSEFETTVYPGATPEDLAETVRLVEALGRRIVSAQVDTRDFNDLSDAVRVGTGELGRLDVVIANAGVVSTAMSWNITESQWKEVIDVNLTGTFHTAKVAIPIMIDQGSGGSIVMVSSVAGLKGLPFLGHYVASKHGIVGLARTMANELGQFSIRVNTVHPNAVDTMMGGSDIRPFFEAYADTLSPIFMNALPAHMSEPEDIANAVAWLASDEARHVTGIQLPIDIGQMNR